MVQVIGTILAIGLFAQLAYMSFSDAARNIQRQIYRESVISSAQHLATFALAARTYSQVASLTSGTTITVSNLTSGNYLPSGFPSTNAFSQTVTAIVGTSPSNLAVYYQGAPELFRFGKDSTLLTQRSSQWDIVLDAMPRLGEAAGVVAGSAGGATLTSAAPFTKVYLPKSSTGIPVTTSVPGFSVSQPAAVVLFNG